MYTIPLAPENALIDPTERRAFWSAMSSASSSSCSRPTISSPALSTCQQLGTKKANYQVIVTHQIYNKLYVVECGGKESRTTLPRRSSCSSRVWKLRSDPESGGGRLVITCRKKMYFSVDACCDRSKAFIWWHKETELHKMFSKYPNKYSSEVHNQLMIRLYKTNRSIITNRLKLLLLFKQENRNERKKVWEEREITT